MPDRDVELLTLLLRLKKRYPEWRFGQLVCNVASWVWKREQQELPWDVADEDLMRAADEHLRQIKSTENGAGTEEIRRQEAAEAVAALREQAKLNGLSELTGQEIDEIISGSRSERKSSR
jgi:hypothetical protein